MNKLAVTILCCNDRNTIELSILSFHNNCILKEQIDFYLLFQNCSYIFLEKLNDIVNKLKNIYYNDYYIYNFQENKGAVYGFNYLVELTKNYKYVLHLEDDWIHIPNLNKQWLHDSIKFLDKYNDVSTIFLRKYRHFAEKNKYGWNKTINYKVFNNINNFNYQQKMLKSKQILVNNSLFIEIPNFLFTLNPHIRRNKKYFDVKAIPLINISEIDVNNKHPNNWGWAESLSMEKTIDLISYYLKDGIFCHFEDWFNDNNTKLNRYLLNK